MTAQKSKKLPSSKPLAKAASTTKAKKTRLTPTNPFADVYARLQDLGLSKKFVRDVVLPTWWDDEAAGTAAGRAEGLLILARHLGLKVAALRDADAELALEPRGGVRFKKRGGIDDQDLRMAERLASQVGRLAALGATGNKPLPSTARAIREQIVDEDGAPWVGLEELLTFCWNHGVVVLHVSRFPPGTKRMQGMAMRADGVPVIVLTTERKPSGWLLFDLAHELGHLCLGHVEENGAVVDETVDENPTDDEERAANTFALELLTGHQKTSVVVAGQWPNANDLAELARTSGRKRQTDPTHLVLNYAHTMGATSNNTFWPVANAALKLLEPEADAPSAVRAALARRLDWSTLPPDGAEFVARMTQAEPEG